jgi:acyl-CoA thioesterase-1
MVALTLTVALACTLAGASPAEAEAKPIPKIVAFGDSLTSGHGIGVSRAYPAVLQQRLDAADLKYRVVNAGVSGDTSRRAMLRLDRALDGDVRIVIVALGANDGLRGVPVEDLTRNLSRIIEGAQRRGATVLLCGMEALPIYGWAYSVAFHKAYRELAARYDVPLVPFMLAGVIGNPDMMQPDRVHPNVAGARAIADNVWPYLKPLVQRGQIAVP